MGIKFEPQQAPLKFVSDRNLNKSDLRKISGNGYTYSGYWDDMYHFSKRADNGYYCISCTKDDILNDNIYDMFKLEVTR